MRNGTGWLGENPSYWEGAGSTSVEMVTQRPEVGVEGRRVMVGREGAPALVGLGTSVLGFKDGRRRLAAVCCQLMVFLRQSLGLSRGVDEREADEPAGSSCSQMESRCHRGSGRVSVGGVHGVGRRYPGVPVFKKVLSRSKLARRCQSCGPCPPQGGAEVDDGTGGSWHVLVDGGRESSSLRRDCPSSSGAAVLSALR